MRAASFGMILLLLGALAHPAAGSQWRRIAISDFLLAVDFPVLPEIETTHSTSAVGDATSMIVAAKYKAHRISTTVTKLPRAARWLATDSMLRSMARSRFLAAGGFRERATKSAEHSGFRGETMEYEYQEEGKLRQGRVDFFIVRGHLVMPNISYEPTSDAEVRDRFFASLALNPEQCRKRAAAATECRADLRIPSE